MLAPSVESRVQIHKEPLGPGGVAAYVAGQLGTVTNKDDYLAARKVRGIHEAIAAAGTGMLPACPCTPNSNPIERMCLARARSTMGENQYPIGGDLYRIGDERRTLGPS
jgi:hypothetical protein